MSRLYLLCLQDHIAKSQLKSEDAIDDTRCRDGVYKASRLPVHSVFSQGQAWPAAVVGFARLEKALGSIVLYAIVNLGFIAVWPGGLRGLMLVFYPTIVLIAGYLIWLGKKLTKHG